MPEFFGGQITDYHGNNIDKIMLILKKIKRKRKKINSCGTKSLSIFMYTYLLNSRIDRADSEAVKSGGASYSPTPPPKKKNDA